MPLADYQIQYAGVTMGAGTKYRINLIDGFRSLPQLRTSDYARLRHHGAFSGIDVLEGRHVTMQMHVVGTSAADLEASLSALETATVPLLTGSLPLSFKLPGQVPRRVNARVRKRDTPMTPTYIKGWQQVDIAWFCSDPRIYDDSLTTTVIPAGSGTVTNAGDFPSNPVMTLTPTSGAIGITNNADPGGIIVLAGTVPSPCVLDFQNRTIVDGGGANRFDVLVSTSTWTTLRPGANVLNVAGANASVAWRSAWL